MSNAREIAQLGSAPSGRRNLIINGAMQVAQRGTSFTNPSSGSVICDRWALESLNTAAVDWSQSTDAPDGFKYSLKADVTTADTSLDAGQYSILLYKGTEVQDVAHLLYGTSGAKQLTLSFWVKSTKTGTYSAELALENGSAQVVHSRAYTINASNTWEKKELTFDGNTVDSFGNSANGQGLYIYFWLAAGSIYQGSPRSSTWDSTSNNRATGNVNFLDSTSNEFYITGVQLEVGSVATEFEHRSYGEELALCQRYYEVTAENQEIYGVCCYFDSTNAYGEWKFNVEKRANPAIGMKQGTYTNLRLRYAGSNYTLNAGAGWSASGITTQNARHNVYTSPLIGTVGQSGWLSHSSGTTQLYADAEL
jgi:hypothetical protein